MTTHDKIIDFYRSMLRSLSITENEDGILRYQITPLHDPQPIMVPDKTSDPKVDRPLAMPTKEVLSRLNEDGLIGFNPLCESTIRGESEIFRELKFRVSTRINVVMWQLVKMLIMLARNEEEVKLLDSNQMELLARALGGEQPSDKFLAKFEKVWIASAKSADEKVVTIYIKRDAKQPGVPEPYTRAAIVNFPLAREIEKTPNTIAGITVAKYEVRLLSNILNALLPGITEDDRYSYYSNPINVPNLTVLLNAWYLIANTLNVYAKAFEQYLLDPSDLIETSWFNDMQQLPRWNGVIPSLEGNVGDGEEHPELKRTPPKEEKHERRDAGAYPTKQPQQGESEEVKRAREILRKHNLENQDVHEDSTKRPITREREPSRLSKDDGLDLAHYMKDRLRDEERRRDRERESSRSRHRPYGVRDRFNDSDDRDRRDSYRDRDRDRDRGNSRRYRDEDDDYGYRDRDRSRSRNKVRGRV